MTDPSQRSSASERRQFPRYSTAVPLFYLFCSPGGEALEATPHQGFARDFSEGGFKVEGFEPDQVGAEALLGGKVWLKVIFTLAAHPITAFCSVCDIDRSRHPADRDLPWTFRLKIEQIDKRGLVNLKRLCIRSQLEARQSGRHAAL